MTSIKLIAASALAATLVTSAAHADTRVGVGARAGIGGFPGYDDGVALAIATSGLHAELAASQTFHRDDAGPLRGTTVVVSVLPVIARRGAVALEVGLSAGASWVSFPGVSGTTDSRVLTVRAPVRIEADVTSWLTLHAEAGVDLLTAYPQLDSIRVSVLPGGQYLAGFTAWF
jgi:hypothetical protein